MVKNGIGNGEFNFDVPTSRRESQKKMGGTQVKKALATRVKNLPSITSSS
jgi:hypothetical protein